jgi:hypothetical protein
MIYSSIVSKIKYNNVLQKHVPSTINAKTGSGSKISAKAGSGSVFKKNNFGFTTPSR